MNYLDVLVNQDIRFRQRAENDFSFLEALYLSVRWEEMASTGWSETQISLFLKDQFKLQTLHYDKYYADAEFQIVQAGEEDIGRLYIYRSADEIRIVDISLMPSVRNKGLGGALLDKVCTEGKDTHKKVSIHVEVFNPAQRLYLRKGFKPVGEPNGPYQLMEWSAN
ncbi:GNAT family N-acetyltransferase [Pokkaliibacter sp. MBI-7]|uniref:GNAT family N-acetyltransferase n=1 Tax=Pokkaliibacter sp. MBI-7 TaxID=3040600 RepID=UPI00244B0605|nr:GNAT family N-acetyltransferase [Pokkaliibacter sp. MBI-7]MDH2435367.1 GNAT family N-acetyltransferase [Pokkaliibacter sp. MBI-7]